MIKVVLTGAWVCVVTLAAVYFSVQMATTPPVDPAVEKKAALEMVKGESITVPLIKDDKVRGYFIGRISYMMNKEKLQGVTLPMTEYMTDELFTLLVGNSMIEITNPQAFKLDEFKKAVREDLNKRLGDEYIAEVLVEQLDYMSKDDIRSGQAGGKGAAPLQIVKPAGAANAAATAGNEAASAEAAPAGGH
jgi:hypothetical protein